MLRSHAKLLEAPRQRAAALHPWLHLLNLWRKLDALVPPSPEHARLVRQIARFIAREPDGPLFPATRLRAWVDSVGIGELLGLLQLAQAALYGLCVAREFGHPEVPQLLGEMERRPILRTDEAGRIELSYIDPLRDLFWPAIVGAHADRFGLCAMCGDFYFATRRIGRYGSKCCSDGCTRRLRQREFGKRRPDYWRAASRRLRKLVRKKKNGGKKE